MILILFFSSSAVIYAQWLTQNCPIDDDLHNVFFVNDSTGWICTYGTGKILHTNNGGNRWFVQTQLDSLYFEQIQFINDILGFICGEYGFILRTTDGGSSWFDISPQIPNRITRKINWNSNNKPEGWYIGYYSMYFFTGKIGFAAGQKISMSKNEKKYLMLNTFDGGNTWFENTEAPNDMLFDPFVLNSSSCIVPGTKNIYMTTDSAVTWHPISQNNFSNKDQYRSSYFFTDKIGLAVNFSGKIIKTTNDGKNWSEFTVSTNRLRDIFFIDDRNGIIIGDNNNESGSLYLSTDGGDSWNRSLVNYPDLHRIISTESRIWIVGKKGTILVKEKHN